MEDNTAKPEGNQQGTSGLPQKPLEIDCADKVKKKKWDKCMVAELCAMVKAYNESARPKVKVDPSPSHPASKFPNMNAKQRVAQNAAYGGYLDGISDYNDGFEKLVKEKGKDDPEVVKQFHCKCRHKEWSEKKKGKLPIKRSGKGAMNPDHCHPAGQGGHVAGPLKWCNARVNSTVGPSMDHDPTNFQGGMSTHASCKCDSPEVQAEMTS